MRLRLNLKTYGGTLSFNYQHPLSAAIYSILAKENQPMAEHLHTVGFRHPEPDHITTSKFVFSKLYDLRFSHQKGDKHMTVATCSPYLFLSVYAAPVAEEFVKAIFIDESFELNGLVFHIESVQVLPPVVVSNLMQIRTLSPLVIRINDRGKPIKELPPDHPEYFEVMMNNLISKYECYHEALPQGYGTYAACVLSAKPYKNSLIWIKNISNRAYHIDFELRVDIPALLQIGFECGFGSNNAQGFGYCVPLNQKS